MADTAQVVPFDLRVCGHTGDPGCLGWPDYHDGPCEWADAEFHRCTGCGRDDVYGEIEHDISCPLNLAIDRLMEGGNG